MKSKRCIKVEIPEARNLPSADHNGLSDPFFWLYFNNARKQHISSLLCRALRFD